MASEKQTAANRRNGRKGGPKTVRGKAKSRMNALKHGARAERVLLPDEDPAEFEAYRQAALRDLQPVGFMAAKQAERIVRLSWRVERCERIEAGLLGGGRQFANPMATALSSNSTAKDPSPAQFIAETLDMNADIYRLRVCERMKRGGALTAQEEAENKERLSELRELADVAKELREAEQQDDPATYDIALAFRQGLAEHEVLMQLSRYEMALRRELHRETEAFYRLQAAHKAAAAASATVIEGEELEAAPIGHTAAKRIIDVADEAGGDRSRQVVGATLTEPDTVVQEPGTPAQKTEMAKVPPKQEGDGKVDQEPGVPASKPEGLEPDHAEADEACLGLWAQDSVAEDKQPQADQGENDGVAREPEAPASKPEGAGLEADLAGADEAGAEPRAAAAETKKAASEADQVKGPNQAMKRRRLRKRTAVSEEKEMEPA